jgi:hypothetical protein
MSQCLSSGTYQVRNEIETKRNKINENETKRNEINKNETKRNETNESKTKSRKQSEIEKGRKNNRGLKEIKSIFTITMLDYSPHMSVFHQERTGFDHH